MSATDDTALRDFAEAAGIATAWRDVEGRTHEVGVATLRSVLDALGLPADPAEGRALLAEAASRLPPMLTMTAGPDGVAIPGATPGHFFRLELADGVVQEGRLETGYAGEARLPAQHVTGYHRLTLDAAHATVAVAPARCPDLAALGAARHHGSDPWGLAVQIASLRRAGDGGIGDFGAVAAFARAAAREGAAALAVSPAHALFAADPMRYGPYAPSTRLMLNPLLADPRDALGRLDEPAAPVAERDGLIDWPAAGRAKYARLRRLFARFADDEGFVAFRRDAGPALEQHARFEALHAHFYGSDPALWDWRHWPDGFHGPEEPGVQHFVREHPGEVAFHAFCQWLADSSVAAAQRAAREAGMPIGLIADLAVGTDAGGSHAWCRQQEILPGVSIGAPPDSFSPLGQDWGLVAFSPLALRAHGFSAFLEMLRAALRHAGGVRIDHAMGLQRLWVVPQGGGPADGAYLRFPFEDLVRLLALEAERHRALVIGEDLGTLPEGFHDRIHAAGILGMRVMWFERDAAGRFRAPETWSRDAVALTSTHDLPTVAGWWRGLDVGWRARLGLFPDAAAAEAAAEERGRDRGALWQAMVESGVASGEAPPKDAPEAVVDAAPAHLGRSACALAILPVEDAVGGAEQPNLPGTIDQHPNWQRRLPGDAATLLDTPAVAEATATPGRGASPRRCGAMTISTQGPPGPPRATLRLQFHPGFTLDDAVPLLPYMARLGISHVYASPILTSRPGSTHGYDIVDHDSIDPELGGEPALRRLVAGLHAHGMGLILDIVPNHMGVGGADNAAWLDVLEWGRQSPFADWFDIDWEPPDPNLRGRLLAPFLGAAYGEVLASGDLRLAFDDVQGKLHAQYFEHRFPIAPAQYRQVLVAAGDPGLDRLAARFERLGLRPRDREAQRRAAEEAEAALRDFVAQEGGRPALDAALAAFDPGTETGRDRLHRLLERQHYRLAWWRAAADEINWRRFFDVNSLAGLKVEEPEVFDATHALVLRLYAEGAIDGLRIDHVDGLADPRGYCRKLYRRMRAARPDRAPLIWVEKILAPFETLRRDWLVAGTTGYDFMDEASGVLHDPEGEVPLTTLWTGLTGRTGSFEEEARDARRQILRDNLASELNGTAAALKRVANRDLTTRDVTLTALRRALAEVLAHFPVYRLYITPGGRIAEDERILGRALAGARRTVRATERPLLDLLDAWLGGEPPRSLPQGLRRGRLAAAVRFQQLSAPVAAKSVEDTAFYRYGRLISRNEVGADPGRFAVTPAAFHAAARNRARDFPASLLATATHDHKRGEDVRARLAVLSEIPSEWEAALTRWTRLNAPLRKELSDGAAPGMSAQVMLYQTLVGAWPLDLSPTDEAGVTAFLERVAAWQEKALREAKRRTEWAVPNAEYEAACRDFIFAALAPGRASHLLEDIAAFAARLAPAGAVNGLSQLLLRCTAPGIPDLYQGCEFWDFSLVDPDNRRPVDWPARQRALEEGEAPDALLPHWRDGRVKQAVLARALGLRASFPGAFAAGAYLALQAEGAAAAHVLAFARRAPGRTGATAIAVTTRLPAALLGAEADPLAPTARWADTRLPLPTGLSGRGWRDVLTGAVHAPGGSLRLEALLARLPVALLVPAG